MLNLRSELSDNRDSEEKLLIRNLSVDFLSLAIDRAKSLPIWVGGGSTGPQSGAPLLDKSLRLCRYHWGEM